MVNIEEEKEDLLEALNKSGIGFEVRVNKKISEIFKELKINGVINSSSVSFGNSNISPQEIDSFICLQNHFQADGSSIFQSDHFELSIRPNLVIECKSRPNNIIVGINPDESIRKKEVGLPVGKCFLGQSRPEVYNANILFKSVLDYNHYGIPFNDDPDNEYNRNIIYNHPLILDPIFKNYLPYYQILSKPKKEWKDEGAQFIHKGTYQIIKFIRSELDYFTGGYAPEMEFNEKLRNLYYSFFRRNLKAPKFEGKINLSLPIYIPTIITQAKWCLSDISDEGEINDIISDERGFQIIGHPILSSLTEEEKVYTIGGDEVLPVWIVEYNHLTDWISYIMEFIQYIAEYVLKKLEKNLENFLLWFLSSEFKQLEKWYWTQKIMIAREHGESYIKIFDYF